MDGVRKDEGVDSQAIKQLRYERGRAFPLVPQAIREGATVLFVIFAYWNKSWEGTFTRNASRRFPDRFVVQIKYFPVISKLPFGALS